MKKFITTFLGACLLFAGGYARQSDQPYDYPVKPGSAKWQTFTSVQDMYNACQIPARVLNRLSTKALLQTCLHYPAMAVLLVQNTPQQGFDAWRSNFNGINNLLGRPDVAEALLDLYTGYDLKGYQKLATDVDKGGYTFRLKVLEQILAQKEVTGRLSATQQKQLIKTCLSHYSIMESDTVYGFSALASTGRIIAGIASLQPAGRLKASTQSAEATEFVQTGVLTNRETLSAIIAEAKKDH